jgi:formylglycine-generating enzyme required for sulfatase activity
MSGNVAEWCSDWYAADYYAAGTGENPTGPPRGTERVVRGGSWLSPEAYRADHYVATRSKYSPDTTSDHIGFRAVRDTGSRR